VPHLPSQREANASMGREHEHVAVDTCAQVAKEKAPVC
jgi:hypothetical protein